MVLGMAYTCSKEEAQEWKQEIAEKFPEYEIVEGPLSLSVACHIGPGAYGSDLYEKKSGDCRWYYEKCPNNLIL